MKPIKGKLQFQVNVYERFIGVEATWTDEDGNPLMCFPTFTCQSGGVIELAPIFGVLGISETSEMKVDWAMDPDQVGAEVKSEGGAT